MIPPERIPTEYLEGYERARRVNESLADNYIVHTMIGDPVMDALLEEMVTLSPEQVHRFINAGMQEDEALLKEAPQALRDFFFTTPQPEPDWLDYEAFAPGFRAFQRNAANILAAFVAGTLLIGFSTLISKSFVQTGRIFDNGVWRLRQNNRHMLEIFFPGGLERQGDGWKLSVRIRFIHGQVRRLLLESGWDTYSDGVPLSAAHLGYAVANFAGSTIDFSSRLGAKFSPEERAGFYAVWRYSGYLMGIPESILYTDESSATGLRRIALLSEPPPGQESILMSNALINSAPLVAGIENSLERSTMVNKLIYPVSRDLIGSKLADQLRFPRSSHLPFPVFFYKLDQRIKKLKARFSNKEEPAFATLLMVSAYGDEGLSYRLPDHVEAESSSQW